MAYPVRVMAAGIIEPVSLRLQESDGGEEAIHVRRDGEIAFASNLAEGTSYTVTFASDAGNCVLEEAEGVIEGESPQVILICPMLEDIQLVTARAPELGFMPTKLRYEVEAPLMAESVAIVATAIRSDIEITVAGMAVASGQASEAISLVLGGNEIAIIARHAPSGASIRHVVNIQRANAIAQHAYAKASNTGAGDLFGAIVALSATGDVLAISAVSEASQAAGIGGEQEDDSAVNSGAVYVFARVGESFSQQAYIKASNNNAGDSFGRSLSLSATGDMLIVGAPGEDSSATGIGGDQSDDSAMDSGAVYVFTRVGESWSQQAYIKASNTGPGDLFGSSVALSAAGDRLAVGAPGEDSSATGIGGDQSDDSTIGSGAVYTFVRMGETWSQEAYIKASNTGSEDYFGVSMALSGPGDTLAVGAYGEDSSTTGINGNEANNSAPGSGAVYVFARMGESWRQQAYIKASNAGMLDLFGWSIALSGTGDTLAVAALWESSSATGIGGEQEDDSALDSGAVYVFGRTGESWRQQAYIKASNAGPRDYFGTSVALSSTGDTLAVGAIWEDSMATGSGGNELDDSGVDSGAVYMFARAGETWRQGAYIKPSNTGAMDLFGWSVALSGAGDMLAASALWEDSAATGIDSDEIDDSAPRSGAVYLFY